MNSNTRIPLGVAAVMLAALTFLAVALLDRRGTLPQTVEAAEPEAKQPADNSMCYVCHLTLKTEEITTVHASKGYGCTKCHGASQDHMHDEMLMTTPDLLFGRREVDRMCSECHKDPHQDKEEEVNSFLQKWRGRERPNGRAISEQSICTDCHGTHNIDKELKSHEQRPAEWIPVFNGRDLSGWRRSGEAIWKVKLGRIVGTPGPKGGGDLWTEAEYQDYLMAVTFRAAWPIHAGIWLHANDSDRGPRVEIFKNDKLPAFTGSVGLPGKGLLLVNLCEELFDPGGWNTLSVEVRGRRVRVWLNGEQIGAVRAVQPAKGRIGLHLQGGPAYQNAEFAVREVLVQKLPKEETETE